VIRVNISHDFTVGADAFWDLFFSEEFNAAKFPALELDREVVEFHREGEGATERIRRVQRFTSRADVPAIVRKFVDGAVGFTAHNDFTRADSKMSVRTVPAALAAKLSNEGTFSVVETGEGRCRRTYTGTIEVRVPIVGKKIEQQIAKAVESSYDKAAAFTRDWLARH
jgi:protein-L-isoaspartate O-methyltransferase